MTRVPVKLRLLPAVKGVLEVLDQIGLPRQAEQPLLGQATHPDEVHTLFHQKGHQVLPKLLFIADCVLQALTKNTCQREEAIVVTAAALYMGGDMGTQRALSTKRRRNWRADAFCTRVSLHAAPLEMQLKAQPFPETWERMSRENFGF